MLADGTPVNSATSASDSVNPIRFNCGCGAVLQGQYKPHSPPDSDGKKTCVLSWLAV